jgi:hypothetical protein
MTNNRKRGRAVIDWQQAFLYYAALPPHERSYQAVAAEFEVSVRTVERHGMVERWQEQARAIDAQALADAAEAVRRGRADQISDVQKLIEASLISYAQQLREGRVRLAPADLPRLVKLSNELWANHPEPPPAPAKTAESQPIPIEHMREVLRGLYESGALDSTATDHEARTE